MENYNPKSDAWKQRAFKALAVSGVLLPIFISAISLKFTSDQIEVAKKHNEVSVKPILQITPYIEGVGRRNGLYLSNDGLGPAIITEFSVAAENIEAKGFGTDQWKKILSATDAHPNCFATAWPKGITTIRPSVDLALIFISNSAPDYCYQELVKLVGGKRIHIEVKYQSLYEENFKLIADSSIFSEEIDLLYKKLMLK